MRYDVIIAGGSYAGMSAGLQLARARRNVLVIDAGQRRRPVRGQLPWFSRAGRSCPGDIVEEARRQLLAYPTVEWVSSTAIAASQEAGGFAVETVDGQRYSAQCLLLACGVIDELPDVEGLTQRWGKASSIVRIATATSWNKAPSACWRPRRCRSTMP